MGNARETYAHLFFECDFSQNFWWMLNQEWNLDQPIMEILLDSKPVRLQSFYEMMILGCWSTWTHRNGIIFGGDDVNIHKCFRMFKKYFSYGFTLCIAMVGFTYEWVHNNLNDKPSLKEGMQLYEYILDEPAHCTYYALFFKNDAVGAFLVVFRHKESMHNNFI